MPERRRWLVVGGQIAPRPEDGGQFPIKLRAVAAGGLCAGQQVCESDACASRQRPEELDRKSRAQERAGEEEKAISRLQDRPGAWLSSESSYNTAEAGDTSGKRCYTAI